MKTPLIITLGLALSLSTYGQKLKVRSVSAGLRVFEQQLIGVNPLTVPTQLNNPVAYLNQLSTLPNSSIYGGQQIARVVNHYVGIDITGNQTTGKFWKRHSVPIGIVWTGRNLYDNGAIGETNYVTGGSGVSYEHYRLERRIQFFGLYAGLIRHFRLTDQFFFVSGIQLQLSKAIHHEYRQFYDTTTFHPNTGMVRKLTETGTLEGKNYWQWQAFIPIAFEYQLFHHRLGIRVEADLGMVSNPVIEGSAFGDRESLGLGFSLNYRFK